VTDSEVAVIGAGVVGCAAALALSRSGVSVLLLEAEAEPGLGASGANSGILHVGFDSHPGELETRLILRSAELRDAVLDALGIPVLRCGAVVRPSGEEERRAVAALSANAEVNGVEARLRGDGALEVPGEAVTNPVAYTLALAAAAERNGAELRTAFRVGAIESTEDGLSLESQGGDQVRCRAAVNCAGLYADEVARLAGDESFEIYPRKGEFLVFDPDEPPERVLLPVPTRRTKGVLVFPTLDGRVVAGPTAVDQEDKRDWSVRAGVREEILPKAAAMWPAIEGAEQVGEYAGLRPAGRGVNYVIQPSAACPRLVHAAAIRSTGLTASLAIAERVRAIVRGLGVPLAPMRELEPGPVLGPAGPWWRRTLERRSP
jgi:glycerol-3-phosphate dehydrogenase